MKHDTDKQCILPGSFFVVFGLPLGATFSIRSSLIFQKICELGGVLILCIGLALDHLSDYRLRESLSTRQGLGRT